MHWSSLSSLVLSQKKISDFSGGCHIRFLTTEAVTEMSKKLKKNDRDPFSEVIRQKAFTGKMDKSLLLYGVDSAEVLLLLGIDEKNKMSSALIRKVSANAIRKALDLKKENVFVDLMGCALSEEETVSAMIEGLLLGSYRFSRYSSEAKKIKLPNVTVCGLSKNYEKILHDKRVLCESVCLTRDLVNENADRITPKTLAEEAQILAKKAGLKIQVLDEKELRRKKFGLISAVGQAAQNPPRLIVLEYLRGGKNKKTLAIVGKGITFDSGGLNLKPTGNIEDMRYDMAGAAAVLGALYAIARLKLSVNVIGVMACAENAIGKNAYKPGDIFTAYNGKTVEIGNTDAEGRLVLADALSYVEEKYNPDYAVDLATLTGAVLVALGTHYAGLMSKEEELQKLIIAASEKTDEKVWALPLTESYMDEMKSDIADLKNTGKNRNAGSILGAVFLSHFVQKMKWAHLDIAGTAWCSEASGVLPKNATGFGVRLLTELCQNI
jgi:leucyl aminopeptidase